ncbi:MAG: L-threonylcarbamoyladenylate synthase [Erysipelotrichaceae bacterium]
MKTLRIEAGNIKETAELLKQGKVVAFPTDTVYGLGVVYDNEEALNNLKIAKTRDEGKPIPFMIADLAIIKEVAKVGKTQLALMNAFMPGACTLILEKKDTLASYISNGLPTLGVRMPSDEYTLELIRAVGKPLLVTSANISGQKTGTTSQEVIQQLDGRIDAIVLGKSGLGIASTIIDATTNKPKIIREGTISQQDINEVLRIEEN